MRRIPLNHSQVRKVLEANPGATARQIAELAGYGSEQVRGVLSNSDWAEPVGETGHGRRKATMWRVKDNVSTL